MSELSPFAPYLGTDFIPDDVQSLSIKAIIAEKSALLTSYQQNLAEAKKVYDDLLQLVSSTERSVEQHDNLIAPLRRGGFGKIPDDVIREILLLCIPRNNSAVIHPSEPPLLLTQVCHNWRRITLDTPRLWASIYMLIPDSYPTSSLRAKLATLPHLYQPEDLDMHLRWQTASVQRWLDLSRPCSLDIAISRYRAVPQYTMSASPLAGLEEIKDLLKVALTSSDRWKRLRVSGAARELADSGDAVFPMLEKLVVTGGRAVQDSGLQLVMEKFGPFSAPHLHDLTLDLFKLSVERLPIPWGQLTVLNLYETDGPKTIAELVTILGQCTQLVHASIAPYQYQEDLGPFEGDEPAVPDDEEDFLEEICLPHLKTFDVAIQPVCRHPFGFTTVSMPVLEDLGYFWDSTFQSPILSIAQRCNLHRLNLAMAMLTDEEFLGCLRSCPDLRVLTMVTFHSNMMVSEIEPGSLWRRDMFLRLLTTPDAHGDIVCPKLEDLECDPGYWRAREYGYSDEAVLDLIEAKQGERYGLSKLRRLAINFHRRQMTPLSAELEAYKAAGLHLVLVYAPQPVRNEKSFRATRERADVGSSHGRLNVNPTMEPSTRGGKFEEVPLF